MSAKITVLLPSALRSYAEGVGEVEVEAGTVGEALDALTALYPEMRKHLFAETGTLRSFVNVFAGETNIQQLQGLKTPLKSGDSLMLIPAIAGGAPTSPLPELPEVSLSKDEISLYSRHLILPEVGMEGQKKLKAGRVLLVGTGGLGAPLGLYLAAAGVGTLGLVDYDIVEDSNLQRQVIHSLKSLGRLKTESARERILSINPRLAVQVYNTRLSSANALDILRDFDVIVDGTDNFPTRYLLNDACVLLGKPLVYGSVFRFEGQATVFDSRAGGCLRCLYPEPPAPELTSSCGESGVLGVVPGIVGCIQANEVIKLLVGGGKSLLDRLLVFDAWAMRFREFKLQKNPRCPICGEQPSIRALIDYEEFCGVKPHVEEEEDEGAQSISPLELQKRLQQGDALQIIDIRLTHELTMGSLPGAVSIPMPQLFRRMDELDPKRDVVLVCKKGEKSVDAALGLLDEGYAGQLFSLEGGMNAWARDVDPSLPQY